MRKQKQCLFHILLLFSLAGARMAAQEEVPLHLLVTELTSAGAPRIYGDSILLTCRPDRPVRFVGAAFSHENYRTIRSYSYNDRGVYFLILPVPADRSVQYRIIIDGVWMPDPANATRVRDASGLYLSVLPLPERLLDEVKPGLNIQKDGRVRFVFQGDAGARVSIAGDFNNWDPFMYFLEESVPGTYAITIRMTPGRYRYYFFYDGNRVPDPWNTARTTMPDGQEVSTFLIPPT